MNWQHFITSDEKILAGKPIIKGTRISVELFMELLSKGWSFEDIRKSYPHITEEQILAVFAYLKDCMQNELYFPKRQTV